MAGKECADIVFCIDKSASMQPCIEGVKNSINQLIETFKFDKQRTWDVRLDYLAHSAGETSGGGVVFSHQSIRMPSHKYGDLIDAVYKNESPSDAFFTSNVEEFKSSLSSIKAEGDEATLVALDTAMDFPWRPAYACHRVIVLLSDEPIETGVFIKEQQKRIDALVEKIHKKRIKLFIIAPQSDCFEGLGMADRCEYETLNDDNNGLRNVDFGKLMSAIGKSVSSPSNQLQEASNAVEPLFGQRDWGVSNEHTTGR